ncbi:MAG TPA: hypothetical protein ENI75_03635 [Mizugakiibacter sp.]|nr:hypothetical protein [Mizugakiibacter sp.]
MQNNPFATMLGFGFGMALVALIVTVLISALILMWAFRLVEKSHAGYAKALLTTLAGFGALFVTNMVLMLMLGWWGILGRVLIWVADFFVFAWMVQLLLKHRDSLSYSRACLVTLVDWAINFGIGLVFFILLMAVGVSFMHAIV